MVHTLLKATETVPYDWLDEGLKVKDFKRFAALAATTYERDVGIITPNAKVSICVMIAHSTATINNLSQVA